MIKIGVYGSLKKGHYNNVMLKGKEPLEVKKIKGTMYRVSSYPVLMEYGDKEYDLEIYEVDKETYLRIFHMEIGAGYRAVEMEDYVVFYGLKDYNIEGLEEIDEY